MNKQQAEELKMAATMHDLGKIAIPDSILLKPGKLDDNEYDEMKKHAEIGGEILSNSKSPLIALARTIAMTHHEKWDGTGYPNGLSGEEIPLEGRISAIADVFDALTSVRPYKKAWAIEDALAFIEEQAGKHFDPNLVPLFIQQLPKILEIKQRFKEHNGQYNADFK